MTHGYKVGVVGAGNMGSGIAQKMAMEGLEVVMADVSQEAADRGLGIISNLMQQGVDRGVFDERKVTETFGRITATADLQLLRDCDLVVEAIFEDEQVKGNLFKTLDEICEPRTVFATNTSSLYVGRIAEHTARPDRVIGLHYFFHPAKNRLVEIIPHTGTSEETVEITAKIAQLHGKVAIFCKDAPGFAVNRFFVPFLCESVRVLADGVANIPTIEKAAKDAFKIGMGPFELMNVTGIPIAVHASTTLGKELGPFYATPQLLIDQMESKELWDLDGEVDEAALGEVTDRLYATTLGVACAAVKEGVATLSDVDRGAKLGLAWRYGPFELLNAYGTDKVYAASKKLEKVNPHWTTPELLAEQARSGEPFEIQVVDLAVKGEIAYITINRPEAMNALNGEVVRQLEERFSAAEADPAVKAIAVRGAGKAFIGGADIKFFIDNIVNNDIARSVTFTKAGHELLRRFETSEKLTIAVVDGLSLGGGSELALACQAIVATPAASFGFPETGIGIYPGLGGMFRSARIIGTPLAKYFVLTGRGITAQDALDLGIITTMTTLDKVEEAVAQLVAEGAPDKYRAKELPARFAEHAAVTTGDNAAALIEGRPLTGVSPELATKSASVIARKAPIALRTVNSLMDEQDALSIDQAIEVELAGLEGIFSTADALAGLRSAGRQAPVWQNR